MNPRFSLETERLVLRLPHPEDVRTIQLGLKLSEDDMAPWMPGTLHRTQKQTREYVYTQMALFAQDENYLFGVFGRDTGAFMGMAELGPRVPRIPSFEISYWVRSDLANRGYMTEAVAALAGHAFEHHKANRVFVRTAPENTASIRVAQKTGFLKEAHLRNDALGADGKPCDTVIYGHTAQSWAAFAKGR